MFKSPRDIIRSFNELAELSDGEADAVYLALNRRHRKQAWLSGMTGPAVFWAWMLFFGKGAQWLESHYQRQLSSFGTAVYVLFWLLFPTGIALAVFAGYRVWSRLLRSVIEADLTDKRCFWCGYCLTGLESEGGRVRCPECAQQSPVRV